MIIYSRRAEEILSYVYQFAVLCSVASVIKHTLHTFDENANTDLLTKFIEVTLMSWKRLGLLLSVSKCITGKANSYNLAILICAT